MMTVLLAVVWAAAAQPTAGVETRPSSDPRNIRNGLVIPDEGYCDQPCVVISAGGNGLCTRTTGRGEESEKGQHVVATVSPDRGRTWSPLINIKPADGPASFLVGCRGYLQADAFSVYVGLYAGREIFEVACWVHARRKFYDTLCTTRPGRSAS